MLPASPSKPMNIFHKAIAAGGTLDGNTIVGAGAVMGNVDRYNDVIFPGAFKSAIKGFLADGFMPVGHDWSGLPVAMPSKAYEKGNELIVEAEFHSTEDAQEAKTVVSERLAKGLSIGLSIGFSCAREGVAIFEEGAALLEFASKAGYDLGLFDSAAIKKSKWVRAITKVGELFEVSIVTVPANPKATASALKSLNAFNGGEEVPDGLTFAKHSDAVLGAVREFVNRATEIKAMRDEKGASIDPSRVDEIRQLQGLLESLLESPKSAIDVESELKRIQRDALLIENELIGSI